MNQKAILVGVNTSKDSILFKEEMAELKALCSACEIDVLDEVIQNLENFNHKTYIGKGKIDEVKTVIASLDIDTVIFNDELSPTQIKNLQDFLEVTIFDRTYIILEIFKRRAKTKEAILQVDIASLKYMMPRLVGLRQGLSRQRGAGGAAHGKGQGETQLELDRRNIEDRISLLKSELKQLTNQRLVQRQNRKANNIPTVSLVGYTNSGKSSTLNALLSQSSGLKKEVLEKDMLFATLETATRAIHLPSNRQFLITDTVGFVHKLPHQLIEAFKSTLEEIKESSLLLHIVDASNENYEQQIITTNNVLKEIGIDNIPIIYVFNKIDRLHDYFYVPAQYENAVRFSAKTHDNLEMLLAKIEKEIFIFHYQYTFAIPYERGDLVHLLNQQAEIFSTEYSDKIIITAKINERILKNLHEYIV